MLRRIKFNLINLFGSDVKIPSEFKILQRKETNYQSFLNQHLNYLPNKTVDLYDDLKIFGKDLKEYELSKDIFSDFDFSDKKLKPAFFNIADVKVPYEASRLQNLQKANSGNIDVNKFPLIYWNSPMDVAIRNINLILHLLAIENGCGGIKILGNNEDLITTYISQHYEFINNNLENSGDVVGNHYLIELASILLTIATFSFDGDTEEYIFFHDELSKELERQFYEDGTNFEGSTHYSAFVVESLIICKLAVEEIDKNSILLDRIEEIIKSNKFFLSSLVNKGELSQIGDNDSGRIFYHAFDEKKPLRMDWLFDLIESLYPELSKYKRIEDKFSNEIKNEAPALNEYKKVLHKRIKVFSSDFKAYSFKDFGIFVWRNDDQYFSVRCGPLGQNGVGGHSHYDQLAIECFTNDKWIARDPGTGTYTDNIELRNKFRSLEYHWGPKAEIKFPEEDEFDCFRLNYMSDGEVLVFDKNNFLGYADFNGKRIYRKISIEDGIVTIEDYSKDVDLEEYTTWGEEKEGIKVQFSEGYKRIS
ncbi:MAG: hypothetical protein EVA29_02640 [Candidatus Actinomarinales bacterium]|nr:MAG: hypothetical protein EVA29_02640 [Candidatus Actinomarinales bacterium]